MTVMTARAAIAQIGEKLRIEVQVHARKWVSKAMPARSLPTALAVLTGDLNYGSADLSDPGVRQRARAQLDEALNRERRKARTGHPRYSFNRHLALHQALAALGDDACGSA